MSISAPTSPRSPSNPKPTRARSFDGSPNKGRLLVGTSQDKVETETYRSEETKRLQRTLRNAQAIPPFLQYTAVVKKLKTDLQDSLRLDKTLHILSCEIESAKSSLEELGNEEYLQSDDEDYDEEEERREISTKLKALEKQYDAFPKSVEEVRLVDVERRAKAKLQFLLSRAEDGEAGAQYNIGICYLSDEKGVKKNYARAVEYIRSAADQGYVPAYYELGLRYAYGEGIEKDDIQAAIFLKNAADEGFAAAEYSLGVCHLNGKGVELDIDQAMSLLTRAAKKSFPAAMRSLAQIYEEGGIIPRDFEAAIYWYKQAADANDVDCICTLRKYYETNMNGVQQDDALAFQYALRAAQLGCPCCQLKLSIFLKNEFGIERGLYDDAMRNKAAAIWCARAAAHSNAQAQCNLGWCYHDGDGVAQSYDEAIKWWKLAAENEVAPNAVAMYMTGMGLENGQGIAKDLVAAVSYFRRAAEMGDSAAQLKLGWCYEFGQGIETSVVEAARWYQAAAEQENAEAQNKMALFYEQGIKREDGQVVLAKEHKKAVQYLHAAADSGHASAQGNLGLLYERGSGVTQSDSKAIHYLRLAAEQGDEEALCNLAVSYRRAADSGSPEMEYNLARCYAHGHGVKQDGNLAVHWYKRAALHGFVLAKHDLAVCLEAGFGAEKDLKLAAEWYQQAANDGDENAKRGLPICYQQLADEGDAEAMCFMAMCYENAIGLEQDFDEAAFWYRKAAERGYSKAAIRLVQLNDRRKRDAEISRMTTSVLSKDSNSSAARTTRALGSIQKEPSIPAPISPPAKTWVSGGEWKTGKTRENLTLMFD